MTVVSNTSEALNSPYTNALEHMLAETRAHALDSSVKEIDRLAIAHDASHYLLVPAGIVRPDSAEAVADIFRAASAFNLPLTFRSGGTSLSGQASGDGLMVDTRRNFKKIEVLDGGKRVRVQPGATVMAVNNMLAPYGYKLGPDPASWSACTIGGVVANNSSGMSSGTEFNTYNTLESMVFVLPSGTVIDTSAPDADARLRALEPEIHEGLLRLRKRVVENPESVARIRQQYSMKNTMGYGVNSLLDYSAPVDILQHLLIGSEERLGSVASASLWPTIWQRLSFWMPPVFVWRSVPGRRRRRLPPLMCESMLLFLWNFRVILSRSSPTSPYLPHPCLILSRWCRQSP